MAATADPPEAAAMTAPMTAGARRARPSTRWSPTWSALQRGSSAASADLRPGSIPQSSGSIPQSSGSIPQIALNRSNVPSDGKEGRFRAIFRFKEGIWRWRGLENAR